MSAAEAVLALAGTFFGMMWLAEWRLRRMVERYAHLKRQAAVIEQPQTTPGDGQPPHPAPPQTILTDEERERLVTDMMKEGKVSRAAAEREADVVLSQAFSMGIDYS